MTHAAETLLEAFDHLSPADREEFWQALLHRITEGGYEALTDDELLAAGRAVFAQLDESERQ